MANLITADRCLADGFQDINALDDPSHLRLPKHRFEYAARRGWGNDLIRDAFYLHLRTSEARALTPNTQADEIRYPV